MFIYVVGIIDMHLQEILSLIVNCQLLTVNCKLPQPDIISHMKDSILIHVVHFEYGF